MRRRDVLRGAGSFVVVLQGCERITVRTDGQPRIIPDIVDNDDFYVYSYSTPPEVDRERWTCALKVDDAVAGTLDLATLQSLPLREKEHTLQCIGSTPRLQLIGNAIWGGLPLREVFEALGIVLPDTSTTLVFRGADQYHAAIPFSDLDDGPVWLVWEMNGEPLPDLHGSPARLLVPGRYGVKNVKWPVSIEVQATPHVSYWTTLGWDEFAEYKANAFIASPPDASTLDASPVLVVRGTAFAGDDPIVSVEVSVDDGPFEPAGLDYAPGADIWAVWSFAWRPTEGIHTLQVRATSESGETSEPNPGGTNPLHGYDGSMKITVKVEA